MSGRLMEDDETPRTTMSLSSFPLYSHHSAPKHHTTPLTVFLLLVMKDRNSRSNASIATTPMTQMEGVWIVLAPSTTGSRVGASIRRCDVAFVNIIDNSQCIRREQKKSESTGTRNQNHGETSPRFQPALFPPANLAGDRSEKRRIDLSLIH